MGWRRKLNRFTALNCTQTNNFHSNRLGIPAVAAHPPISQAAAERLATAVGSTLLLPVSTRRPHLAHTATSPRLVRTRAAASQKLLRRTLLRHLVATMALGTIRRELWRILLHFEAFGFYLIDWQRHALERREERMI